MRCLSVAPMETGGKQIFIDGNPTGVSWTKEAVEDLLLFHDIDIKAELAKALIQSLSYYNLTEEERLQLVHLLSSKD